MDEWIVDVISFQKIFGLCGLKGHIVEIRRDATLVDNGQQNVKIELEFWIQNSQNHFGSLEVISLSPQLGSSFKGCYKDILQILKWFCLIVW